MENLKCFTKKYVVGLKEIETLEFFGE